MVNLLTKSFFKLVRHFGFAVNQMVDNSEKNQASPLHIEGVKEKLQPIRLYELVLNSRKNLNHKEMGLHKGAPLSGYCCAGRFCLTQIRVK